MAQFLASRGYVVIEPEFRGSAGYGAAHQRAGYKQYGKAMQDDVADALLWAQKQGIASERACIAGASYGGYATLMGLARHPELYRCGAAWVALTDLLLYVEGSWWVDDDISDFGRRVSLIERVGNPKDEAERAMLIAQSPIHQGDRIQAPVLLAFGEDDRRIPLQHGKRMREALEKAGRTPEWVVYPGEGHGWRLPRQPGGLCRALGALPGTPFEVAPCEESVRYPASCLLRRRDDSVDHKHVLVGKR